MWKENKRKSSPMYDINVPCDIAQAVFHRVKPQPLSPEYKTSIYT